MDTTDQARAVAETYATAWLAGNLAGIVDSYADDFTLHYFGDNPFTGDHVGKQAALDTLLAVGARAPRTLLSIDEIMAGPLSAVMGRAKDPPTDKMAPCTSAPIGCRSVP